MMMVHRMGNYMSRGERVILVHVILTDEDIIWTRKYEIVVIEAIVAILRRGTIFTVIVIMDVKVSFFLFVNEDVEVSKNAAMFANQDGDDFDHGIAHFITLRFQRVQKLMDHVPSKKKVKLSLREIGCFSKTVFGSQHENKITASIMVTFHSECLNIKF